MEPGGGWDYTEIGNYLAHNPSADGAELGKIVSDSYLASCKKQGDSEIATMSVIDLSKVDKMVESFNAFAKSMYDSAANSATFSAMSKKITKIDNFGGNNKSEGYTNMVDYGGRRRRYCGGDPDELVDLVDSFKDESLGMCIDTGHAHASGIYVPDFIRLAGKRLKCTHIDDNFADKDSHLPPFMGTVDWKGTMKALREIGYDGDFSFEIGPQRTPFACRDTWYRYIYSLGMDLLSL
jgi:hypothetical protein